MSYIINRRRGLGATPTLSADQVGRMTSLLLPATSTTTSTTSSGLLQTARQQLTAPAPSTGLLEKTRQQLTTIPVTTTRSVLPPAPTITRATVAAPPPTTSSTPKIAKRSVVKPSGVVPDVTLNKTGAHAADTWLLETIDRRFYVNSPAWDRITGIVNVARRGVSVAGIIKNLLPYATDAKEDLVATFDSWLRKRSGKIDSGYDVEEEITEVTPPAPSKACSPDYPDNCVWAGGSPDFYNDYDSSPNKLLEDSQSIPTPPTKPSVPVKPSAFISPEEEEIEEAAIVEAAFEEPFYKNPVFLGVAGLGVLYLVLRK